MPKKSLNKGSVPTWDLSDLYSGPDDPVIQKDFTKLQRQAVQFEEKYEKAFSAKVDEVTMQKMLREYERIAGGAVKIACFGELYFSPRAHNSEAGAFRQKTQEMYQDVMRHLIFFDVAWKNIPAKRLKELLNSPKLKNWKHYIEKQLVWSAHRLSTMEEKIIGDKNLTGREGWLGLFDQEMARMRFMVKIKNKTQILGEDEVLQLLHHPDRKVRKEAAESLGKGLAQGQDRIAYIYNRLMQDKMREDALRGYELPESAQHLSNEIDLPAVDTAIQAVVHRYGMVQEFYAFKRKLMGVNKLYDYDRYAPVGQTHKTYSWEEAKNIVLTAFGSFSEEFRDTAQLFFDNNWIDGRLVAGKRGGAYCMYVTPDKHPYVFMNFGGSQRDVLTLAHELGHAIQGYLARKNSLLHFDWPLTIAETASVFGEMLVFDNLQSQIKNDADRLTLYVRHIENIFATVFRQVTMFRFERQAHEARRQGEVGVQRLNELWRTTQQEMFGKSVTLHTHYDSNWSYIPHFFHSPFYVYSYAFGNLLALALYEKYKEEGHGMVKDYLKAMSAGGSISPKELLAQLGMDWHNPEFWEKGLDVIEEQVKEAKRLHKRSL